MEYLRNFLLESVSSILRRPSGHKPVRCCTYNVILDEKHFKDFLLGHVRPPEAKVNIEASLIRMGFPQHLTNSYPSLCMCHVDSKDIQGLGCTGYFCPQCKSKYCELPVECKICNLTLVSAPHLARSYQHLFPLAAFEERKNDKDVFTNSCHGCQKECKDQTVYLCQICKENFCNECDLFIHETLHTCPGCSSQCKISEGVG